ncbi:superoxide dismutase family protein [Rhodobacteraceae bacterium B1Z28]|uniref:Superoxide dismutase family protein n=1 Tax=Ruegeria haliotis TaxID=2747601 RepID=A0ABX2PVH2_9RHOB|nr:superoxide dismutase family protein [Ruegeria haliotis]NVO57577.1 superoxide dismutase family protein [Ruegeria haliotis]
MSNSSALSSFLQYAIATLLVLLAAPSSAEMVLAPVYRISTDGVHEQIGTVVAVQREASLEIRLWLDPFPPGWHAMHVHDNPDCGPAIENGVSVAGGAAGGHFDPNGAMADMVGTQHMPAVRDGKARQSSDPGEQSSNLRPLGDLPAVYTNERGTTDTRILSYRLHVGQIRGRSLILHAHPETTDDPRLPSGGGPKIACAIFPD